MQSTKILIAIPAFNEEDTISATILFCRQGFPNADILVVNDCSADSTLQILEDEGTNYLSLPFNLGVGGAMRAAFKYALENNYSFLVQVDADGQHIPSDIFKLLSMSADYDVVIGSRFLGNNEYRLERFRKYAIRTISIYLKLLIRQNLSDPTSGFRLSNRRAIELFASSYPIEYLGDTVGSIVLGSLSGLKFGECPTPMLQRQGGTPSQGKLRSAHHLVRTLLTITMMRLGRTKQIRGLK